MEKIISINFQGRVIPIEESAYNSLRQYTDSLKRHFANEESSDEIINDIENRIAELLGDRVKRGAPCIVMADVLNVIDSIGRLEDMEAAEKEESQGYQSGPKQQQQQSNTYARDRFYRNEDDKVIAGVCSGIAIRTGVDPVIVRIFFVLLCGALFWLYVLLWIIVPSKSLQADTTRRLYRNPDDKVLGGVCGGLAAYFRMDARTVRLIFLIPLVISIVSGGIHAMWWHWTWGLGPRIFIGSLGSSLLLGYLVLWIAVPYASSAADKLEMRGEKVDLNSIKAANQARGNTNMPPVRHRSGIGHVIAVLFKAFFMFIAGVVAVSLFCALIGLFFGGMVVLPFTDFVLNNPTEHALAWTGVVLVLGIPMLALITWIVRRMSGMRSTRNYLGYVFSVLWVGGLFCIIILISGLMREFSTDYAQEEQVSISQPAGNRLYVNVSGNMNSSTSHSHRWWYRGRDDNNPFRILDNDSLWLNTVKVRVAPGTDSLFHIYKMSISHGNNEVQAKELASHISFNISQQDSMITLPRGFVISKKDKFRNQQVIVVIEVPVGKTVKLDRNIQHYDWFNVTVDDRRSIYVESWEDDHYYRDREYNMTRNGLKKMFDTAADEDEE